MVDPTLLIRTITGFIGVGLFILIAILLLHKYLRHKYVPMIFWGISMLCFAILFSYSPVANVIILAGHPPLEAKHVSLFYNAGTGALAAWVMAWSYILYKARIKLIGAITCSFVAFLTLTFFIFYFFEPTMLMTFHPPSLYTPGLWIQFNGLIMIIVFLLTGIVMWIKGRKSEERKTRIKGILFLLQSIFITSGSLTAAISGNIILEFFSYGFVIVAGIVLYLLMGVNS